MNKYKVIPLLLGFLTANLLFFIGYLFNIDIFMFKILNSSTEVAFLPIIIGLLVTFVSERIINSKI